MTKYDYLIVGSGLYGSVFAQQMKEAGKSVIIVEKRNHIGGNCHSYLFEDSNIIIHTYGTHLFHTNDKKIWDYINQFGEFNRYQHKVLTTYQNKVYPLPINLATINNFYGTSLKPSEVDSFLENKKGYYENPKNLEEKAISLIGSDLYEAFIKGYTLKQWQCDPRELPASIINRLPVRSSYRDSYFDDLYQGVPVDGYTPLFEQMLLNIPIELEVDFFKNQTYCERLAEKILYTGPIDHYFEYSLGRLNWRSVRFELENVGTPDYQGTSVMNFADVEIPFTRIHEPKHLHPERKMTTESSVILREFSHIDNDSPYYPVNTQSDRERYNGYKSLSTMEKNVLFGGRLAQYKYYDMHHVIAEALAHSEEELTR